MSTMSARCAYSAVGCTTCQPRWAILALSVDLLGHPRDRCKRCPAVPERRVVAALDLVPRVILLRCIPDAGKLRILEHRAVPGGRTEGRHAVPSGGLVEDPAVKGGVIDHHKALSQERNEAWVQCTERGRVRDHCRIQVMDRGSRCGNWICGRMSESKSISPCVESRAISSTSAWSSSPVVSVSRTATLRVATAQRAHATAPRRCCCHSAWWAAQ